MFCAFGSGRADDWRSVIALDVGVCYFVSRYLLHDLIIFEFGLNGVGLANIAACVICLVPPAGAQSIH